MSSGGTTAAGLTGAGALKAVAGAAVVVAALFVPYLVSSYTLLLVTTGVVFSIAAVGMILLIGEANQLSLGGAAFFALGAYTPEILVGRLEIPWALAVLAAVVGAAAVGAVLAFPLMRLDDIYLAIATLGLVLILQQGINALPDLTGGSVGMSVSSEPSLFGLSFADEGAYFQFVVIVLVLALLLARNLRASRWGRSIRAARDSGAGARSSGVSIPRGKLAVFVISSAYLSLAGALYGHTVGYLASPEFGLFLAIELVVMAVIGGPAFLVAGAVLGGFFVAIVPEVTQEVGEAEMIVYGGVLVLVALLAPRGIGDVVHRLLARRAERRREEAPSTDVAESVVVAGGAS